MLPKLGRQLVEFEFEGLVLALECEDLQTEQPSRCLECCFHSEDGLHSHEERLVSVVQVASVEGRPHVW